MSPMADGSFDREVGRIRQEYGGDREWKDQARLFAHFLYWKRRESDQEEDTPDLEPILRKMIRRSMTDKYIWDAVNHIAQAHLTSNDVLPRPLAVWIECVLVDQHFKLRREKLLPRPSKGRRVRVRDWIVCSAIEDLVARGYTATRSGGGDEMASAEGGSACDIVGVAFFKSYKTIEGIWGSRHQYSPGAQDNPLKRLSEATVGRQAEREVALRSQPCGESNHRAG